MTFFFFVVGLEIKREVLVGELADKRQALLPIAAAFGGMIVPALVYIFFNKNGEAIYGWEFPWQPEMLYKAKIGIIFASFVAGIGGYLWLLVATKKPVMAK